MKKLLSDSILGIIICVCGYLIIANILHIIYLNKYETFDFDSSMITTIKSDIEQLETNIEKIKNLDNSIYEIEDIEIFKEAMNENLSNIKSNPLLSYKGKTKFYLKDLYNIDTKTKSTFLRNLNVLQKLSNYDKQINEYLELYKSDLISASYSREDSFLKLFNSYKYNTTHLLSTNILEPTNYSILTRIYNYRNYIKTSSYITSLILEIGDVINE